MSVSNLVRNVLGHAFGLVGDVVADSHAIARAARGEKGAPDEAPDADDVIGWQSLVRAKNAVCARCNTILPKGKQAAIGMTARGAVGPIVCTTCMESEQD